jgi:hypothetical protein
MLLANTRFEALVALLAAVAVTLAAAAGVAALSESPPVAGSTVIDATPEHPDDGSLDRGTATVRGAVMSGTPPPSNAVVGTGSNYQGTAGWIGQATVALPGDLGGRYTGEINGHVTVCAHRCVRLPVVDWCECYWGSDDERVVDLSHEAWTLVTDAPLERGLVEVRLILER